MFYSLCVISLSFLSSATDNLYTRCRRVLQGIRRHGGSGSGLHERLSEKQKAGMDSVAILREETCFKLDEIQTYLTDFRDIIQSIAADTANTEKARANKRQCND
jgi:hypothetical protein